MVYREVNSKLGRKRDKNNEIITLLWKLNARIPKCVAFVSVCNKWMQKKKC